MKENNTTPIKKSKEISRFKKLHILNILYVRFMAVLLALFFLLALLFPLRPRHSETENRELAPFPRFSFSSLFSGEYFDGIATWYADTFPLRDKFVSLNAHLSGTYGQSDVRVEGEVVNGDDIPDIAEVSEIPIDIADHSESEETETAPPEITAQTIGAVLINGDTAYEYYNFVRDVSNVYVSAVNRAASLLEGKATVYAMIVPTSMGITAPEYLTKSINTSDQKKAIDYMYGGMSNNVKKVQLFDMLKSHKKEYIYFRTDHHWTALGAYYAYAELMKMKGETPLPLSAYTEHSFPGYLGSFYNSTKKLPQLAENPDTVYAYQPPSTNQANILYNSSGQWKMSDIISDMSSASASSKYIAFIKGDNPITYIKNPNKNDESVCLLIKESFGNAFAPFPVENYQHLYILDYRYFSKYDKRGLAEYCAAIAGSSLDVVFLNNISATRSKGLMNPLSYFVR